MRTATHIKDKSQLNIVELIMTLNLWEFFITDKKQSDDIVQALVMGYETEIGDVSLKEISPFIQMRTKDLQNTLPPEGYKWND